MSGSTKSYTDTKNAIKELLNSQQFSKPLQTNSWGNDQQNIQNSQSLVNNNQLNVPSNLINQNSNNQNQNILQNNQNLTNQGPNILQNNQLLSTNLSNDPSKLFKENRSRWSWEQQIKYEIKQLHRQPIKRRNYIMELNLSEAKLRDARDNQAKLIYKQATKHYLLVPQIANLLGELSRHKANVSNYHEALLNRLDAKVIQEIDVLPDMKDQLNLQLKNYLEGKNKYDKLYAKEYHLRNSGNWLNFFTPTPKQNMFNQNMMMNPGFNNMAMQNAQRTTNNYLNTSKSIDNSMAHFGHQNSIQGPANFQQDPQMFNMFMQNNQQMSQNNRFNQPEKAPSQCHIQAKKTKDMLEEFSSLMEKAVQEILNTQLRTLLYEMKAYIEYHVSCLEIYTQCFRLISKINSEDATSTFMKTMGLPDLLAEMDQKIKMTSNEHCNNQYMGFQNSFNQQNLLINNANNAGAIYGSGPSVMGLNTNLIYK